MKLLQQFDINMTSLLHVTKVLVHNELGDINWYFTIDGLRCAIPEERGESRYKELGSLSGWVEWSYLINLDCWALTYVSEE